MRAKPDSTLRSTLTTVATARPGGYTPSTPLVISRSPGCTSALPDMKRSSIRLPSPEPKAALRCCVRGLSTGIAASLSASSVISEDNG